MKMLTAQKEIATLQYSHFGDDLGVGSSLSESILEFLSTKPEGASSDLPLPVLTSLRYFVFSHQLEAVKQLIQSRSGEAAGCRITPLREVDMQVRMVHGGPVKPKEEKTAMFNEFANKGMKIRITFRTWFGM